MIKGKKITALFMSLILSMSLLPIPGSAEGTEAETIPVEKQNEDFATELISAGETSEKNDETEIPGEAELPAFSQTEITSEAECNLEFAYTDPEETSDSSAVTGTIEEPETAEGNNIADDPDAVAVQSADLIKPEENEDADNSGEESGQTDSQNLQAEEQIQTGPESIRGNQNGMETGDASLEDGQKNNPSDNENGDCDLAYIEAEPVIHTAEAAEGLLETGEAGAGEPNTPEPDRTEEPEEKTEIPVIFTVTPPEATVMVYSLSETGIKTEIPAEEPNRYLLMPGDYYYIAACDGYETAGETEFRVSETAAKLEILVTLTSNQPVLIPLDTEEHLEKLELAADNDALIEGFIAEALYGDVVPDGLGPGLARKNFGASLFGNDARLYQALKTLITEVANGERVSTEFEIPASEVLGQTTTTATAWNNGVLDVNMDRVTGALMYDCPYEQYWMLAGAYSWNLSGCPEQSGNTVDISNVSFAINFFVAQPYAPSGQGGGTRINPATAVKVNKAVSNAKNIVSQAAGMADTEKLRYYGNRICALVDYNYAALNNMTVNGSWNNNPWELIWTFDGDSSTNVVCEGYAKSFQYLCDLTAFDRNIACYCLEGPWRDLTYGGGGGHMWNAVTMDNGVNYLVDLTHSDDGSGMSENVFLLKADSGNPTDGYYFTLKDGRKVFYGYDQQCFERSTEAARTITLNREYLASPLLKSAANITGGIKVTWEKVPEATQYIVYRKTGSESWKKLGTSTSTSYTDTTPIAGIKYVYTVKAQKGSTVSGYDKTGKTVTYLYGAPELKTASSVSSGIKLTWKKEANAAKYRIYRKGPGDSSWKKLSDVSTTSYTDKKVTAGNRYTYTVRSLNSAGTVISSFNKTGISCRYELKLEKPAAPALSNVLGGVKISWKKVDGAVKYRVFRKESGEGSWSKAGDTTALNYTDRTAVSGKKYSYAVRCVTSDGKKYSSDLGTAKAVIYIAAPTISKIANITGGIQIKWKAVSGASRYRIYRKTDNGAWKKLGDSTSLTYKDKTAVINTTYTYRVRCVSADGRKTISGYDSTGKTITSTRGRKLDKPVVSSVTNIGGGIKVSWNSVKDAAKYRIYRKGPGDTSWKKVGDTTALTWKDTDVASGAVYSYAVRCVTSNGKKATSALSAGRTITHF